MATPSDAVTGAYSSLAAVVRRDVLYYLLEQPGPVPFETLATHVAARRTDSRSDAVDPSDLEAARTVLHHQHLPKLAEAGLITSRGDAGPIALADVAVVRPILEAARRTERSGRRPA